MNDPEEKAVDTYRSFLLMSEIAKEEPLSQRELARRVGIALGLVNSYLRNLAAKGYIRVKTFPRNRYGYLLTPQGFAEKSRLAYQHLGYFTSLYTTTRQDYRSLLHSLEQSGVTRVIFCGVDEVAEIAYLSLRETGMELAAVMDDAGAGDYFFDSLITPLTITTEHDGCAIVITSLKKKDRLLDNLCHQGVEPNRIFCAGIQPVFIAHQTEER